MNNDIGIPLNRCYSVYTLMYNTLRPMNTFEMIDNISGYIKKVEILFIVTRNFLKLYLLDWYHGYMMYLFIASAVCN